MFCNKCETVNKEDAIYCMKCGMILTDDVKQCRKCKTVIKKDTQYCPSCGVKQNVSEKDLPKKQFFRLMIFLMYLPPLIFLYGLILMQITGVTWTDYLWMQDEYIEIGVFEWFFEYGVGLYFFRIIFSLIPTILCLFSLSAIKKKKYATGSIKVMAFLIIPIAIINILIDDSLVMLILTDYFLSIVSQTILRVFIILSIILNIASVLIFFFNKKIRTILFHKNKRNIVSGKRYMKLDHIPTLIILNIITLGIYKLFWSHKVMRFLKDLEGDRSSNAGSILLLMFIPFYNIYWFYKYANKAYIQYMKKEIMTSDFCTVVTIFEMFIPFISVAILADKMNTLYKYEM